MSQCKYIYRIKDFRGYACSYIANKNKNITVTVSRYIVFIYILIYMSFLTYYQELLLSIDCSVVANEASVNRRTAATLKIVANKQKNALIMFRNNEK